MELANVKFCVALLFILTLSSICSVFTVLSHYNDLTILAVNHSFSFGTREIMFHAKTRASTVEKPSSLDNRNILLPNKTEDVDVMDDDFKNFPVVSLKSATKPLIQGLSHCIANVERDVLTLNVEDILKPSSDIPLEESRLIHKVQHKLRRPDIKCVIRIAKYCPGRRACSMNNVNWKQFRCEFSEFCHFETSFIGNLTQEIMQTIDVIFFKPAYKGLHLERLMSKRPHGQLWIMYSRESPHHDMDYAPPGLTGNPFNLTMNHARVSDIHFPCASVRKLGTAQAQPPEIPKKTKLIAWMAKNCSPYFWQRTELVKEIKKHIPVDMYGKCGMGSLAHEDTIKTLQQYKFYLSFENSECQDYITEKAWKNALSYGIVPIVYGSKRESYEKTLPRDSFIFVEDFSNMSAFVDYIHALDTDEARYMKYFDWRRDSTVQFHSPSAFYTQRPELYFCYLLKKLIHVFFHPETSWQKRTPDFASWFLGQCDDHSIEKNVLGFNVHRTQ